MYKKLGRKPRHPSRFLHLFAKTGVIGVQLTQTHWKSPLPVKILDGISSGTHVSCSSLSQQQDTGQRKYTLIYPRKYLFTVTCNENRYQHFCCIIMVSPRQDLPVKHGIHLRRRLMNCANDGPSLGCQLLQCCY